MVTVTAAGSPAGSAIVAELARRAGVGDRAGDGTWVGDGIGAVVAVADRPGPEMNPAEEIGPDGVIRRPTDLTITASVQHALRDSEVVVHVAVGTDLATELAAGAASRRAHQVRSVQEVAAAAAKAGARRLIVISSATVYGARADNPVPLPDDAPLRAVADESAIGDLLEVERIVARVARIHPGLRTTVVRPAALVGHRVDTAVTRQFEAPRLLVLRGGAMQWQFCHVEDLATAVAVVIEADLDGEVAVGSRPWLDPEEVARVTGLRRVELPAGLAFGTAERLRRVRALSLPSSELALVVHPWVVGAQRLTDAGWTPRFDTVACLEELMVQVHARARERGSGLLLDRREAALGAAGATVAILGTAALLRQARARREGRRRPTL